MTLRLLLLVELLYLYCLSIILGSKVICLSSLMMVLQLWILLVLLVKAYHLVALHGLMNIILTKMTLHSPLVLLHLTS